MKYDEYFDSQIRYDSRPFYERQREAENASFFEAKLGYGATSFALTAGSIASRAGLGVYSVDPTLGLMGGVSSFGYWGAVKAGKDTALGKGLAFIGQAAGIVTSPSALRFHEGFSKVVGGEYRTAIKKQMRADSKSFLGSRYRDWSVFFGEAGYMGGGKHGNKARGFAAQKVLRTKGISLLEGMVTPAGVPGKYKSLTAAANAVGINSTFTRFMAGMTMQGASKLGGAAVAGAAVGVAIPIALTVGSVAITAGQIGKAAYHGTVGSARMASEYISQQTQINYASQPTMSYRASTERQRALQAISERRINAYSALGNEAMYIHR